ncbi:hypothetical protein [Reichenbachiella sp.]
MSGINDSVIRSAVGTSQSQRENLLLYPDKVQLDERTMPEMLSYMEKVSRQFWYYDENDEKKGDWSDFFKTDMISLLAIISDWRFEEDYRDILSLVSGIRNNSANGLTNDEVDANAAMYWKIFSTIFQAVVRVNEFYKVFTQYYIDHQFQVYLKQIIWQKFSFSLKDVYSCYYYVLNKGFITDKEKIDNQFKKLSKLDVIWNFDPFPDTTKRSMPAFKSLREFLEAVNQSARSAYHLIQAIVNESRKQFYINFDSGETAPHISLMCGFLKAYQNQQRALNGLTERHLDFYYQDILDFKMAGAKPDSAYLLLKLDEKYQPVKVQKGSTLSGGADGDGQAIVFGTNEELIVTGSEISQYLTCSWGNNQALGGGQIKAFQKPVLDQVTNSYNSFSMYGDAVTNTQKLPLGFAISSPDLTLAGGHRDVHVALSLLKISDEHSKLLGKDISPLLKLQITGKKGWLTLEPGKSFIKSSSNSISLNFCLSLKDTDPSIVAYNTKVHGSGFSSSWPIMKVVLLNKSLSGILSKSSLSGFTINSFVTELPATSLHTVSGSSSPNTLVMPFGKSPSVSNKLYIGSYEPFVKKTSQLVLNLGWVNLPCDADFINYYDQYNSYLSKYDPKKNTEVPSPYFQKSNFKSQLYYLNNGVWKSNGEGLLFKDDKDGLKPIPSNPCKNSNPNLPNQPDATLTYSSYCLATSITPDYTLDPNVLYTGHNESGFVAIELTKPSLSFGNSIYPQVVSMVTLNNTTLAAEMAKKSKKPGCFTRTVQRAKNALYKVFSSKVTDTSSQVVLTFQPPPGKPFVPKVKDITLSYKSACDVDLLAPKENQFYHIHPYGNQMVQLSEGTANKGAPLIPNYSSPGFAFLGFKNLTRSSILTLFLAVENRLGSDISSSFPELKVDLLTDNNWSACKVLSDGTFGLNKMGILKIEILDEPSNTSSIMPGKLYWLRVAGSQNEVKNCRLTMVGTNAVMAARVIGANNTKNDLNDLSAGKITKFTQPEQGISKVTQPFDSFGSVNPETKSIFRQRVANRIAHKQRLVSIQDYENAILQRFNELYEVKAASKIWGGGKSNEVKISVIPWTEKSDGVRMFQPICSANLLEEINAFCLPIVPPNISLDVCHAQFEHLYFGINPVFKSEEDTNQLRDKLGSELMRFLSPWVKENTLSYKSRCLYTNDIIQFLSSRSYLLSFSQLTIYLENEMLYGESKKNKLTKNVAIQAKDMSNVVVPSGITFLAKGSSNPDKFIPSAKENKVA